MTPALPAAAPGRFPDAWAHLERFWAAHGDAVVLAGGGFAVVLLVVVGWRFARSDRKDRWVARMANAVVLAWTAEGMWEVATQQLGLPVFFAVATFFVAEAMVMSSAIRAAQHRQVHGVPGQFGTLVWVLAGMFGTVVALSASTLVEFLLRLALPFGGTALWWIGLTADHPNDTPDMRAARDRAAREREATWAITPRSLLVSCGLMKPGRTTTTQAQRERQTRRMVVLADLAARRSAGGRGSWLRAWRVRRLRALTRTADPAMIDEVTARVRRAVCAESIMVHAMRIPTTPGSGSGAGSGSGGATRVAASAGTSNPNAQLPPSSAKSGSNTKPAAPAATPARPAPAGSGATKKDVARAHWDAAVAAGRALPDGPELAQVAGLDARTARRHAAEWRAEWERNHARNGAADPGDVADVGESNTADSGITRTGVG